MFYETEQRLNDFGELVYQIFEIKNGERQLHYESTDKEAFDKALSEIEEKSI